MPAKAAAAGEQIVEVDPLLIYFTFSRIRPRFSCGRTIASTLEQFRRKELQPHDLPLLSVLTDGTNYFSQNNRRLYTYKQLRREGLLGVVPVRLRPFPQTKRMQSKYTVQTCALTATLMRDVENSHSSGGAVAAVGAASTEAKKAEEASDEEDAKTGADGEVGKGKARAGATSSTPNPADAPDCYNSTKTFQPAEEREHGAKPLDADNAPSRKQKKQQRKGNRKAPQQQHSKTAAKGRKGNSDTDSEDDAGRVNSLEAELRNLGLH